MSEAVPDLIAGYLEELCAGLRVPAAEAELIAAEAEDHLRETAAAGLTAGMTEREAQEAAISSFGPVRAVVRAHHRRTVTVAAAAMAAWKLTALLATTVGAGGVAGMVIFAYLVRSAPGGGMWQNVPSPPLAVYAAIAAGGLILLATRRLARRGTQSPGLLSPWVTALCSLLAAAPLAVLIVSDMPVLTAPVSLSWTTPYSYGSVSAAPLVAGAVGAGCLTVAVGYGAPALRRAWARAWVRYALAPSGQADRGRASRAHV